jgi:hypothetical protein
MPNAPDLRLFSVFNEGVPRNPSLNSGYTKHTQCCVVTVKHTRSCFASRKQVHKGVACVLQVVFRRLAGASSLLTLCTVLERTQTLHTPCFETICAHGS